MISHSLVVAMMLAGPLHSELTGGVAVAAGENLNEPLHATVLANDLRGFARFVACEPECPGPAAKAGDGEDGLVLVHHCVADHTGRLSGGRLLVPAGAPVEQNVLAGAPNVVTLIDNGPSSNRLDFVFLGDGYTASQMGAYAQHVNARLQAMLASEPFVTYGSYFNFHRVDVVSTVSGVSHDPTYPTWKNTPLGMNFWCNGLEHLLCINVNVAKQFAQHAPDVQQIIALGNSTKYGGAGYINDALATSSSNNFWSSEIILHEIGHSLGLLADEYGGPCHYNQGEPPFSNVSVLNATQMAAKGTKWSNWLNFNAGPAYDGMVSTYVGAHYCDSGIHRPTNDSKMRSLNRPFNLPGIEAFLIELYKVVDPIDAASQTGTYGLGDVLFVEPMQPSGHDLHVQWELDGMLIPGTIGATSLAISDLNLAAGAYELRAIVIDDTWLVRNEQARLQYMTSWRSWTIVIDEEPACPGDLTGNSNVGVPDLLALLSCWGPVDPPGACASADLTGNGNVGVPDLLALLANWGPCLP